MKHGNRNNNYRFMSVNSYTLTKQESVNVRQDIRIQTIR